MRQDDARALACRAEGMGGLRVLGQASEIDGLTSGSAAVERLIGLISDPPGEGEEVRAQLALVLSEVELAALAETKLSYLFLQLADRWGIPLSPAHSEELARLQRRELIMDEEMALIADALADGYADYLLLRGRAIGRFYPPQWPRQYNDIDLLVRDGEAVPAVLARMARHGYYVARPIVSRASSRGIWLGVALNKQVAGLGHPMYVDVCSLGPALSSTRHLAIRAACWQALDTIRVRGVAVPVAGTDLQTALLATELTERGGAYLARDVLDLAMLDRAGVDWEVTRSYLEKAPEAESAIRSVALMQSACARMAGLPETAAASPMGWPVAQARRADPRAPVWRAISVLIKWLKSRNPALARRIVDWAPARLCFACGLPVYLLPPWSKPLRGGTGRQTAGLPGYRGRIYPLVPREYSAAAFRPSQAEAGSQR